MVLVILNPSLWYKFNSDNAVRVIVCDRRAEEGINLQGGEKLVIHFDLNQHNR